MVEGKRAAGSRVAVVDYEGYFTGAALAEQLRNDGYEVEFVTSHDAVAPFCDQTLEGLPARRLPARARGRAPTGPAGASRSTPAASSWKASSGRRSELEVDGVVLVTQRLSDDALYREFAAEPGALTEAGVEAVYRIGDCVAPRLIADAIFDGHRLGREIDSDDPEHALPYLRERPLVEG